MTISADCWILVRAGSGRVAGSERAIIHHLVTTTTSSSPV